MKTNITKEDVLGLREEAIQYEEKTGEYDFITMLFIQTKIDEVIKRFDTLTERDLNALFRGVYEFIGKDFSEYKEEEG